MSNSPNNESLYRFIVNENLHRIKILNCFNDPFPDDRYIIFNQSMIDLSSKLVKQLSFSTNYIRKKILNESNVINAGYHLSKSRLDYYNANYSQMNNANTIFNILNNSDKIKYKYYFVTIDYAHMSNLINLNVILHNMKYFIKNFTHTDTFSQIDGLIVKYELNWNIYDKTLVLSPHYHLIIKVNNKFNTNPIEELKQTLSPILDNPDKDFNIKVIDTNPDSLYRVANYISKDVYYRVFHYINKGKVVDSYQIPYSDIVFTILNLNNYQFFNSYKELYFKQSYR